MTAFRLKPVLTINPALPVIDLPDERPYLVGAGAHDYLCGVCDNGLLMKVDLDLPRNAVIICGKCRTPQAFELAL